MTQKEHFFVLLRAQSRFRRRERKGSETSRKLDRPRKIKNFLSSLFFFSGIPSVPLFFLLLLLLHKAAIKMAGERRKETSKKKRAREKVPHITSKSRALPLCIFQRGTKKEKKGRRYICAAPKSPNDDDQLLQQALLLLLCPKGNDFLISPIWEKGEEGGDATTTATAEAQNWHCPTTQPQKKGEGGCQIGFGGGGGRRNAGGLE